MSRNSGANVLRSCKNYRMHKREVTAIIDPAETSVVRKLLKARPLLGTIDLWPRNFWFIARQTRGMSRGSNEGNNYSTISNRDASVKILHRKLDEWNYSNHCCILSGWKMINFNWTIALRASKYERCNFGQVKIDYNWLLL